MRYKISVLKLNPGGIYVFVCRLQTLHTHEQFKYNYFKYFQYQREAEQFSNIRKNDVSVNSCSRKWFMCQNDLKEKFCDLSFEIIYYFHHDPRLPSSFLLSMHGKIETEKVFRWFLSPDVDSGIGRHILRDKKTLTVHCTLILKHTKSLTTQLTLSVKTSEILLNPSDCTFHHHLSLSFSRRISVAFSLWLTVSVHSYHPFLPTIGYSHP